MWIELHDSTRDHPKIIKLARDLGIPRVQALGHMCSLWLWILRMAPDGDLGSFDSEDLEIAAEWEGDAGKFVESANSRGLIDVERHGMVVHDWGDYATHLKAAERKRIQREKKRAKDAESQDVTGRHRTGVEKQACHSDRPTERPTERPDRPKDPAPRQEALSLRNDESLVIQRSVVSLDCVKGEVFSVTEDMVREWQATYPAIDVVAELRKARQWCLDDPKRRKTKGGARRFLGGWLGRAQNRGPQNIRQPTYRANKKDAAMIEAIEGAEQFRGAFDDD